MCLAEHESLEKSSFLTGAVTCSFANLYEKHAQNSPKVDCAAGIGGVEQASATALTFNMQLPTPDTLVGSVMFSSCVPATISITFAGAVLRFSLSATGTKGSLEARHA